MLDAGLPIRAVALANGLTQVADALVAFQHDLEARGLGRRRYELATRRRATSRRGPVRHWTEERIRAELRAFAGEMGQFPTPTEFQTAGKWGLYLAASRLGGIRVWRNELSGAADGANEKPENPGR